MNMFRTGGRIAALLAMAGSAFAASITADTDVFQTRDKKMGTLRAGAQVTVLQESGEWTKVLYETIDAAFEGYVRRDLVNTNSAGPEIPAIPLLEPTPEEMQAAGVHPLPSLQVATTSTPPDLVSNAVVSVTPPTRPSVAPRNAVELGLASHWQIQSKSGNNLATDLSRLLEDVAKPQVNLAAQQNYILYKDLYYLMPIDAALRQCNQNKVAPTAVNTPGLPAGSFRAYSFDIADDKRFRRLTLVSDIKNQLVAVQLNDSGQKEPWLYGYFEDAINKITYSEDMKLFDVVNASVKGSSNWRVGAVMVAGTNGVVSINTELVSGSRETEIKSRERVRLLLPQPVANLCAWLLQNRK